MDYWGLKDNKEVKVPALYAAGPASILGMVYCPLGTTKS